MIAGFSVCLIILGTWQGFDYVAGIKYARVQNKPGYIYNNTFIIVTNVIMLEFLSARFVYPSAP